LNKLERIAGKEELTCKQCGKRLENLLIVLGHASKFGEECELSDYEGKE
jgi:hypothetical protein